MKIIKWIQNLFQKKEKEIIMNEQNSTIPENLRSQIKEPKKEVMYVNGKAVTVPNNEVAVEDFPKVKASIDVAQGIVGTEDKVKSYMEELGATTYSTTKTLVTDDSVENDIEDNNTYEDTVSNENEEPIDNMTGSHSINEAFNHFKSLMNRQSDSNDMVNHPNHYNQTEFECIDEMVILFGVYDTAIFCRLTAYKYKNRAPFKNNMEEDLQKADWYFNKYLELTKLGDGYTDRLREDKE